MAIGRVRLKGPSYIPKECIMVGTVWDGSKWVNPGNLYYPTDNNYVLKERLYCSDELHRRSKRGVFREGGPLFLKKLHVELELSKGQDYIRYPWKYSGSFASIVSSTDVNNLYTTYTGYSPTAASWGASAYNKFRPVKPTADMGQFLAELRDLPSMFKFTVKRFKDLGGAYLNGEFGWKPFLRDLIKFYETQSKLEKRIAFARKNNGKWIRRAGTVRSDASTTTTSVPGSSIVTPTLPTSFYGSSGTPVPGTKIVVTTDRIWFEGRMKFYIDNLSIDSCSKMWTSPLLRKLYGFELSPSLAWELMPWSWFMDWFLNVGDIFSNASNQAYDNLVTKYAYVMRHRTSKIIRSWEGPIYTTVGVVNAGPCTSTITAECKERASASQWGIGQLEDDELSLRQWAILAALGISRVPSI